MARRWRIRYKLIFGFGLVLGIMALLLLATLRGLLSYYLTMNSIRDKITELRAAEDFKAAVAEVTRLARNPHPQPRHADAARPPGEEGGLQPGADPGLPGDEALSEHQPLTLALAFIGARQKLDEYEHQLDEALHHAHEPIYGEHQHELVRVLRAALEELEKVTAPARNAFGKMMALAPDQALIEQQRGQLDRYIDPIYQSSADLYHNVHDALHERTNESRSHYQITLWISIPTSVLGLLVVCGLVRSFYRWILHPIRDLGEGVARVARGDFSRRIELHSGDEMEDLAAAFNDMMQRLHDLYSDLAHQVNERSRQLVRSERLASVGFLAAGVAHEINNPLASIAFCSEALEARLADLLQARPAGKDAEDVEVFTKYLKMIQEEAFRCKSITESLLAFSRTNERRREPTDLRALVQSVLDVTQHLQNHRGKHITFEVNTERISGGQITAWVNAEEIKSVVLNLVTNGLESMDEGGHLVIRLRQVGDRAELQFTDNGCGMTDEVLENIFEPFFTRSRTGKGTGLGLTISHRIIHQHAGEIEASSPGPGQGSTFVVRLPVQPPPQEETEGTGADVRPISRPAAQPVDRAAGGPTDQKMATRSGRPGGPPGPSAVDGTL